jgi:hypothetical protein
MAKKGKYEEKVDDQAGILSSGTRQLEEQPNKIEP